MRASLFVVSPTSHYPTICFLFIVLFLDLVLSVVIKYFPVLVDFIFLFFLFFSAAQKKKKNFSTSCKYLLK